MRKPIIAGNWKMNNTAAEGVKLVEALKGLVKDANWRRGRLRSLYRHSRRQRGGERHQHSSRRTERALAEKGSLHGRDLRFHAQRVRRGIRHHRTQRTPSVFRRNGRNGQQENARGARGGARAHRVRGRKPRRARNGQDRTSFESAGRGGAQRAGRRFQNRHRVRTYLGDRHGQNGDRRTGERDHRLYPQNVGEVFCPKCAEKVVFSTAVP